MTDPELESEIMLAERSYIVLPGDDRFSQPQQNMNTLKEIDDLLRKSEDQLQKMVNQPGGTDFYHQNQALSYLQRANRLLKLKIEENLGNCHTTTTASPVSKD